MDKYVKALLTNRQGILLVHNKGVCVYVRDREGERWGVGGIVCMANLDIG